MGLDNEIIDNECIVFLDSEIFSKDAIMKCLYWYGDKYLVNVTLLENRNYRVSIKPMDKDVLDSNQLNSLILKLNRDLIDFNLRDIVTKETKNIRDLLVAKAFSNGEFDEMPPGEISDPVGFDINEGKDD
jgi:His-Xaa-Ser system protein HxsD